jgi:nucleoside phosphorylase
MVATRLYLHFLDAYHAHRADRNSHSRHFILEEARRAFRLALTVADQCYIPASSFFESQVARTILTEHALCVATGRVLLTSADPSLEEHREGKIRQYSSGSPLSLGSAYRQQIESNVGYEQRMGATRPHLESRWLERLNSGRLLNMLDPVGTLELPGHLETAWADVPNALGDLAFIPGHVQDVLSRLVTINTPSLQGAIRNLIESSYVEAYTLSLKAGVVRDLVRLRSPFSLPFGASSVSYPKLLAQVARADMLRYLDDPDEVVFLQGEASLRSIFAKEQLVKAKIESPAKKTARRRYRPGVGIVTILEEEFTAVRAQLENITIHHVEGDPHVYVFGRLYRKLSEEDIRSLDIVVAKQLRMTTPSAAATTILLVKAFPTLKDILLVGIGGAIPRPGSGDKDVRLGDVVVSDRAGIYHIDHVTQTASGPRYRGFLPPPSSRLLGALDYLAAARDISKELECRMVSLAAGEPRFARPGPDKDVLTDSAGKIVRSTPRLAPSLFRGVIASGNALVRNSDIRDRIGEMSGALALEMEGAGVAEAAWSLSRHYLLVRGMSDYCDVRKSDDWHWYASGVAATAAVSILEYLFD